MSVYVNAGRSRRA